MEPSSLPLTEENLRRTVSQQSTAPETEAEEDEEFHTEPSKDEDEGNAAMTGPPLLPDELLHPLSTPVETSTTKMQPRQRVQGDKYHKKAIRRLRQRINKRRRKQLERLAKETNGSGVLEAGRAAQKKRGIAESSSGGVQGGRIEKSSRSKLVEQRRKDLLARQKSKR